MKRFIHNKKTVGWPGTLLVLLGCFFVTFAGTVILQVGSAAATAQNFLLHPVLILLNGLPIAVLLVALWALTGNAFVSGSITSLLFHLLSLVNRIKIEARYDPLVPSDFTLIGEAATATGEYQLDLHIPVVIAVALLAIVLLLLGLKCRTARPKLPLRIAVGVLAAGVFVLGMATLYPDEAIYTDLARHTPNVNQYNIPTVFDGLGFNYCFLHNYNLYTVRRPAGYSEQEAAGWAQGGVSKTADVDVIFVQCEAFSDIMRDGVFAWEETENPLYAYDQVANGERAVSGHVIVSNYGAGTANTEYDVLTGMPTTFISEGNTSSFRVVRRDVPSLARTFAAAGYDNYFMHPGQAWFYNRENVYAYFGFRQQVYLDEFQGYAWKGSFMADSSFREKFLSDWTAKRAQAPDTPLLAFTVTIQNHQAYPYSKYAETLPEAKLSKSVSDETLETVTVYAQGIRDSAVMLRDLTEALDGMERPTVLVFWGDHLPALGANFAVYHDLGLDIGYETTLEGTLNTYKTPYTIWVNEAFCEHCDWNAKKAALALPENGIISDFYLGELVYELASLEGSDPYFDFLGTLRRELPVIRPGCYALQDGTLTSELTEQQQEMVEKLQKWDYYRLMDQKIQ